MTQYSAQYSFNNNIILLGHGRRLKGASRPRKGGWGRLGGLQNTISLRFWRFDDFWKKWKFDIFRDFSVARPGWRPRPNRKNIAKPTSRPPTSTNTNDFYVSWPLKHHFWPFLIIPRLFGKFENFRFSNIFSPPGDHWPSHPPDQDLTPQPQTTIFNFTTSKKRPYRFFQEQPHIFLKTACMGLSIDTPMRPRKNLLKD